MKFTIIAVLASICSGMKIREMEFPVGSVNNMNYDHAFQVPGPIPDDRHCQE